MNLLGEIVKVGIADLKVANSPEILKTSGLGSCVGVCVYDLKNQIAGLAHVMLPDSTTNNRVDFNQMKYADTAIELLVHLLLEGGAKKYNLKAKIAGGAQMFAFSNNNQMLRVGERNVEAVLTKLEELKIPLLAEDVGGNKGRTIEFFCESGTLRIKTVYSGVAEI
ncbi:chemotaxis protein CheD [Saliterribacillus persicus]|uniref:Probable chemoreceptor glutamine deamidase CheD n=1 Tax=Saliterribacillus persicus TaxID=930114 RepID=A0A368XRV4_9BACI|nr:chemotaxis protein CheD [Saliterribacillus persicus]RCW70693.1 chemotaxis protein CheD [Saliterribacillus persicus]